MATHIPMPHFLAASAAAQNHHVQPITLSDGRPHGAHWTSRTACGLEPRRRLGSVGLGAALSYVAKAARGGMNEAKWKLNSADDQFGTIAEYFALLMLRQAECSQRLAVASARCGCSRSVLRGRRSHPRVRPTRIRCGGSLRRPRSDRAVKRDSSSRPRTSARCAQARCGASSRAARARSWCIAARLCTG